MATPLFRGPRLWREDDAPALRKCRACCCHNGQSFLATKISAYAKTAIGPWSHISPKASKGSTGWRTAGEIRILGSNAIVERTIPLSETDRKR